MEHFDIAILGSGPAGVSAALTAKARNKRIVLYGQKNLSPKLDLAYEVRNYPGIPNVSGRELAEAFRRHLDAAAIEITEQKVAMVYPSGDTFMLQTGQDFPEADAVILATGVTQAAAYPGEAEFLGRGVSYCATCDAALYRGRVCAVAATREEDEAEAEFLAEYAEKVYYFPLYDGEPQLRGNIEIRRENPKEIRGTDFVRQLVTDGGTYDVDGVFLLRESISPERLVPGLEVDGAHVVTDRSMATNIPGLYAAGDLTGLPYQYAKSVGEGNVAALSAVRYLDQKRRKAEKADKE